MAAPWYKACFFFEIAIDSKMTLIGQANFGANLMRPPAGRCKVQFRLKIFGSKQFPEYIELVDLCGKGNLKANDNEDPKFVQKGGTMRLFFVGMILVGAFGGPSFSQDTPAKPKTINQTCTLQDGKEISIRYERASPQKKDTPLGGLFAPGSSPLLLFTQTNLSIGDVEIPVGAFSLYVVTDKEKWTLVINKNVTAGSPYDEKQDLVRVLLQSGKTDTLAKQVQIRFAHIAPKQCNMRIYYGHTGAWAEFKEK